MSRTKYRFESELHLGLLVIVLVLLALNLVSNFVVFRARVRMHEAGLAELSTASVGIGRVLQQNATATLTSVQITELKNNYGLSDLVVAPALSSQQPDQIRQWFKSAVHGLPPDKVADLSDQLLKAETNKLVRGRGTDYLFVRPVSVGAGSRMLVLSREYPELAYLEDSGRLLLLIGEIGLAVVALVYLLVSRFVLAPFKRMKQKAIDAGRPVGNSSDDVEQVVAEYERIIADLQRSDAELRSLNISIQNRADSLEEFNRYLMAAVDSGVVTLDMNGNVLTVSAAASRMLDAGRTFRRGESYRSLLESANSISVSVGLALRTLAPVSYREHSLKSHNGEARIVGAVLSFIRDHTGKPIGLLILLNDITELATLRSQVEQKNRLEALGEMAGGLAHQLRNSLGAIVGFGALAKKRMSKGEIDSGGEAVESLLDEAHEAEELVARFLTFARPLDYRPSMISLCELLDNIVGGFRNRKDCTHVRFELRVPDPVKVLGDAVLLKQAIANLIENAVHAYDGANGAVEISVTQLADTANIVVSDHGCGISPEQQNKIFTPFYSSRPSGTGLGLPLARRIVDLHGGTITLDSTIGAGTSFTLSIPLSLAHKAVCSAVVTC